MGESGNRTVILITAVSLTVIFVMLLLVFRSVTTTIVILLTVGIELQVARGIIAFLGMHGVVGLTTFVVNLLVSIGIAAGTDYGIFFLGGIRRRGKRARIAKAPSTPPIWVWLRWSWHLVSRSPAQFSV